MVDDQSGIVLPNDDGIERLSGQAANRADADVPGNVTLAFGIGKAELSKPPRKMLPGVIGDDEERRCAVFVVYRERRRLVSRQKTIRRLIHLRPVSLTRRSEEHTSELQSRQYLVCRLLLEKKKKDMLASIAGADERKRVR